jgi:DNA-3-methyladenine glycosylase
MSKEDFLFLKSDALKVAPRLLGCLLAREIEGQRLVGRIVETEAYNQTDAASHSYRGQTPRTEVMFGASGRAYVYFTYGMHYCINVVTGSVGYGSAVLIRALEPIENLELMRQNRRGNPRDFELTNGPAKLCQALDIDKSFNAHDLTRPPLQLIIKPPIKATKIEQTTRIGISRDQHRNWRFYIKNNHYVSGQK